MSDFKIVKLIDPIVVQTNGVNATISGNTDGTPAIISSGTMVLAGGNNITLSQSQNTISIHGGAGAGGGIAVSAGTQLASTGTVSFANSNGLTFGMSGSRTITGSYTVPSTAGLISAINLSAGTTSQNLSKVTFDNSNGVSFGLNGSVVTATVKTDYQTSGAYLTTARASNDAIGLNTAVTNATLTANSSGFSFDGGAYLTTAQPVGAYLTTARASNDAIGLNTAKTNATWTVNSSGFSFDGGAYLTTAQPVGAYLTTARASNDAVGLNTAKTNVTWTVNSSGISLDGGAYLTTAMASNRGTDFVQANAAFNGTNASGTIASNNISVSVAAQSAQTQNLHNVTLSGNTAGVMAQISSGTLTLAGGNNITLSQNGNAVTISGGAAGGADGVNALVVNGGASTASTTLALSNANNVTFGHNAGTITASASYPTQTNQTIGLYGSGNTSGTSTGTVDARSLTFNVFGSMTVDMTNNKINISAPNALTTAMASNRGTDFVQANAAFNGTNASGTIASNAISISVAAPGGGVALKGSGAQTQSTGTVEFANSNGITFGLSNNGTMTASHNGLTTARASNDAVGLNTAQTNVTWTVNSSGISLNAGAYLTTAAQSSASNVSGVIAGTASNAATNQSAQLSGGVSFSNTNGISFFTTASGAVSGIAATVKTDYQSSNANYLTSQSNQALSGSNGSFTFQTATFGNLNGMSFYSSNGSMVGSYTVPSVPAQTNQTIGIYGSSQTTGQSSSSTYDARSLTFRGAGNISVGNSGGEVIISATGGAGVTPVVSNSAGSFSFTTLNFSNANNVTWGTSAGSIVTASVAAPGAAAENNWFALTGANTAGNTTASGSTIGLSGVNLTLSGTNGSAINISAPATSSLSATGQVSLSTNGSTISIGVPAQITHSRYNEFKESPLVGGEIGQASLHIQPWLIPNLQYDRVVVHKAFSNATNSSFSFTVSDWVGIYTRTGNTLSLLQSASANTNFSGSGTAGSYLSYGGGIKAITMGMTNTLTEGMYWLGVVQRTTTGGGAGHTLNQALNSNINSTYRGLMGVATNATNQMSLGFGVYTVSTSGMPGSIAFTEINGNSSIALRPPSVYFVSGTV